MVPGHTEKPSLNLAIRAIPSNYGQLAVPLLNSLVPILHTFGDGECFAPAGLVGTNTQLGE